MRSSYSIVKFLSILDPQYHSNDIFFLAKLTSQYNINGIFTLNWTQNSSISTISVKFSSGLAKILNTLNLRERSSITSAPLGGGSLSQNTDFADTLERGGGLSQNTDMLTLWREGVGGLKHRANIPVKYLKLSIN